MKVKEFVEDVKVEIGDERAEKVKSMLKTSLKQVASAKKTLKALEKQHEEFMEEDVDDLELEDFEY